MRRYPADYPITCDGLDGGSLGHMHPLKRLGQWTWVPVTARAQDADVELDAPATMAEAFPDYRRLR